MQTLSLGNQQRVQLAAALVHDPLLLVLDEPFSGLDPIAVDVMSGVLREMADRGIPVVFSSHQLDLVERLCDRVGVVQEGRMVAVGSVEDLRSEGPRRLGVDVPGADPRWASGLSGVTVLSTQDGRVVLELAADVDDQQVLRAALAADRSGSSAGSVPHWSTSTGTLYGRRPRRPHESRCGAFPALHPGSRRAIQLVSGREIPTRLASRAWRVTTLLLLVLVVGGSLVAKVAGSGNQALDIGLTPAVAPYAAPVTGVAEALGIEVRTTKVTGEDAGRTQVADGSLDALVVGDTASTLRVVVDQRLDPRLENVMTVLARDLATVRQVQQLGGDPAAFQGAVAAAGVHVESLAPPKSYDDQHLLLGVIAGILIFMALQLNGAQIAQGVVEEKATRVVELLLSTVRPWELMVGKVLGIGALGLLQLALVAGSGLAAGLALGTLTLSVGAAAGTLAWVALWFVLGFFAYALAMGAAAALVSRQEDAQSVVLPVYAPLLVGYVLGVSVLPQDPENTLTRVLSLLPPFAPSLMPIRLAIGSVPIVDVVVSVGLMVVTIPLLARLAGRVYRNAVVRTGARVRLREALARR